MGHQNIWFSHPRKYGPGSRHWYETIEMSCLQQPPRFDPKIWTSYVPSLLSTVRKPNRIQETRLSENVFLPSDQ
ncbi:Trafficking protein particle complex subunit 11 [Blomia tropicalis]|nr:Trafficking protein particle complex subunit 11 [Blomia tropicalis]